MAKPKLKAKAGAKAAAPHAVTGKSIMDSAQQIWLAGLGAFAKAQAGGEKLFDTLIKEGSGLEQLTRKLASGKVDDVRGAVEDGVTQVRERTQETWDRLEQVFENRVSRALKALGVPARKDFDEVLKRFDELQREVKRLMPPLPKINLMRTFTSTIRRTKDDLSDLVKDIEDVQLAAKQAVKRPVAKVRKAASKAVKKPAQTTKKKK